MSNVAKIKDPALLPADPMVSMIERVAMDPNVPIERLERMMDMKERMEDRAREDQDRQARRDFYEAMAICQSEMPTVRKSKTNTHTRSTYADISDVDEQAMTVAHKHGFSVVFTPGGTNEKGELVMKYIIGHRSGHQVEDKAEFPLDAAGSQGKVNKTAIQALGSTMTYARRYLLINIFKISTDDDTDGNGAEPKTEAAPKDLWAHTVTQDLPENATPRDKAEAIANALCAQFRRMKGERQMSNEWDRREHLISGEKGLEHKHPDLWEQVVDAYEVRRNEIVEAKS